jgi:class 3 adenylate cyclase
VAGAANVVTLNDSDFTSRVLRLDLASLYQLWRSRDEAEWRLSSFRHLTVARRLLRGGEPLLAFDVLNEALTLWPDAPELLAAQSLALARCGASERANQILRGLYEQGSRDEETISILARTHKDLALGARSEPQRREHLECAERLYAEAFEADRDARYWSGINAATLALLLGNTALADSRARVVQDLCRRQLEDVAHPEAADEYWLYATLAEACLIRGELDQAAQWYRQAALRSTTGFGDIASTRRNAQLVLAATGASPEFLDTCLPRPGIVVFTGHMIDTPERPAPRFPAESEPPVSAALKAFLKSSGARIAFASAACGADILLLEAMLELGGQITIVLPSAPESFVKTSVDVIPGSDWLARFNRVMGRANQVICASANSTSEVYYAYTNVLLFGLAKLQAKQLDGELTALSVWDGLESDFGGTASAIRLWRDCGQPVHVIQPVTQQTDTLPAHTGTLAPSDSWLHSDPATDSEDSRKLVSLLFADAVGFSKLEEHQVPKFVKHFLGPIAELLEKPGRAPIVRNTWGDAVYFVFNDVRAAGLLALDMCELIAGTNWQPVGLPERMSLRIGLHSGPAYPTVDPIIQQFSYTGVQVSRAARIEPITPPGIVYASQEFAALAQAVGVTEFACDYVGQTSLAKHYGAFPTYRVRRLP